MRTVGAFAAVFFCAMSMSCPVQAGFDYDEKGNAFVTGQAIVAFKPGTTPIAARSVLARYGADPNSIQYLDEQSALVQFNERRDVLSFCQQMGASGWSPASGPNHLFYLAGVPNDPFYALQWNLKPGTLGGPTPVGSDFQGAWGNVPNYNVLGLGTKVAILDSGIDLGNTGGQRNPELGAQNGLVPGALVPITGNIFGQMTITNAVPLGPPPYTKALPYFYTLGSPDDDDGHGTHLAGIIAARTGNGMGIAGAAPASTIYPIKVVNRTAASLSEATIIPGIRVACSNGCQVINMSFIGPAPTFALTNAIQFAQTNTVSGIKGSVCVAAMGNAGDAAPQWPACLPGVVAVGAHTPSGARSTSFVPPGVASSTGPWITLVAPGGDGGALADNAGQIFSTYPRYSVGHGPPITPTASWYARYSGNTNYSYMDGTSVAAAHVSAAAALLLQKKKYLSQAQVWAQLAMFSTHTAPNQSIVNPNTGASTQVPDSARDANMGYGLLNANSLVQGNRPAGSVTGIPHVFPYFPRNHFIYPANSTIPLIPAVITPTGMQPIDVIRANSVNNFTVIVVDDRGEQIPDAIVQAHFRLLAWNYLVASPFGYPTTNIVTTSLTDTKTTVAAAAANGDLLPNDCVYGKRIFIGGDFSNCLLQVQYVVTGPGMRSNTNCVVNLIVQ